MYDKKINELHNYFKDEIQEHFPGEFLIKETGVDYIVHTKYKGKSVQFSLYRFISFCDGDIDIDRLFFNPKQKCED